MGAGERALEVDPDDSVEVVLGHREQHLVAQDARVVDEDVELPEGVDRLLDEVLGPVPVGHVVVVGDGLAAVALDDVGHLFGGTLVGALAPDRAPEVVDDDLGPLLGQQERFTPPDSVPSAGDDRDLAVQQTHEDLQAQNLTQLSCLR